MVDTLPKSVRILLASFDTITETSKKTKGFLQKRKKNDRKKIKSSLYKLLTEKTKEYIVSAKGTASPVQMVASKDSSNPLMVDTLPKSYIVSTKGTTSPVQTVVGKDSSNPLMVDTLPKSVRILPASFDTIAETSKKTKRFLQKRKKIKG
ncbi:hypothetical protein H5410_064806 [Solanum commersonii]|uniref:Uncharacterized protein n=1 Tax=Solanum commersonii TaxID=4109 RepID=A0A9J5VYC8_SOLCO|nr:hypothetical protein H5410_064806 [Solanum commersonii]